MTSTDKTLENPSAPDQTPPEDEAVAHDLDVAAQVEIEAKLESSLSYSSFKRLVPGALNVGLIGSTCTALP